METSRPSGQAGKAMGSAHVGGTETFILELLKPSHYDDDGYVIQWWRSIVPSNSLAAISMAWRWTARQRQVLGGDVRDRVIGLCDETDTR